MQKLLVGTGEQPGVVALAEFVERVLAHFADAVGVELPVVALDGGTARVAQFHGGTPLVVDLPGELLPRSAVGGVALVHGFGRGGVQDERADRVGVAVEEVVQVTDVSLRVGPTMAGFHRVTANGRFA